MSFTVSFIILLAITITRAAPVEDKPCDVQAYRQSDCVASIFIPNSCLSATLDLTHLDYLTSCSSVSLRWAYPSNNLTFIIGTQRHQAFTVSVNIDRLMGSVSHIFRIIGNQETEVTTKDHKLVQTSDSYDQVKLKFEVPSELMPYLVFVDYDIN